MGPNSLMLLRYLSKVILRHEISADVQQYGGKPPDIIMGLEQKPWIAKTVKQDKYFGQRLF